MSAYEKTPIEFRAAAVLLTTSVAIFLGVKAYRKIFPSGTDKADKEESKANAESQKSAETLLTKYTKLKAPTYSNAMFTGWANSLYKSMDGAGTSFGTIKNVLGYMQSDTDVLKLIVTFGVRNRKTNNPFSSEATPLTLPSWFSEELSDNEIFELNKILAAKRIGYRF